MKTKTYGIDVDLLYPFNKWKEEKEVSCYRRVYANATSFCKCHLDGELESPEEGGYPTALEPPTLPAIS